MPQVGQGWIDGLADDRDAAADPPERSLHRTEAEFDSVGQALASERAQEADDRSWIARRVINGFAVSIACVLVLIAVGGAMTGQWSSVIAAAVDIIKSAVVPIVTLVLGYYFGRSSR
jgi:hypothetical protein